MAVTVPAESLRPRVVPPRRMQSQNQGLFQLRLTALPPCDSAGASATIVASEQEEQFNMVAMFDGEINGDRGGIMY